MSTFEDLTNKIFGKLTVLKRVENKDNRPYFLCRCECYKEKEVSSKNLKSGQTLSCGCSRKNDLTGQVFGRLTVLNVDKSFDKKAAFSCRCSCGAIKRVRGADLLSKKIVSCGCYRNEKSIENINQFNESGLNICIDPRQSSAISVYKSNYIDGNLTFEQFMALSQMNCFYCNVEPVNNFNKHASNTKDGAKSAKSSIENGNFNYNGLDRIDSSKPHDFDNLVPSCIYCNRSKSNMTTNEFYNLIYKCYHNLNNNFTQNDSIYLTYYLEEHIGSNEYNRKFHPSVSSAKVMFKNYNDGNLTFDKFLELTAHNCSYCNSSPTNSFNSHNIRSDSSEFARDNGDFIYNGLDRIDSSKPHDVDNVVTSCFKCNWSKGKHSVEDHKAWIIRVYNHLKATNRLPIAV